MRAPAGWAFLTLGDVIESTFYGPRFSTDSYQPDGLPTIRTTDMTDEGTVVLRDPPRVSVSTDELRRFALVDGDLLVTRTGSIGKCALYRSALGPCLPSAYLIRVRLKTTACEPGYALAYVMSPRGQEHLRGVTTAVTQPNINAGAIAAMRLPLPPLNEQRRIVAKLDTLMARSRRAKYALDAIPKLFEQFRQSILAAAFRGDLTKDWRAKNPDVEPAEELLKRIRIERRRKWEEAELAKMRAKGKAPGDDRWKQRYEEALQAKLDDLPELPEEWGWATIDELARGDRAVCYGVIQPGEDGGKGPKLVRVCDIDQDGDIDIANLRSISNAIDSDYDRSRLEGGEVLISVVGTIGRTAIAPASLRGANIARAIARISPSSLVPAAWIAFWLQTTFMRTRLSGDAREVARKTLNIGQLQSAPIPIPASSEWTSIIEILRAAEEKRRRVARSINEARLSLAPCDASVLAKAFRGELVPQDRNDEPASVLLDRLRAASASSRVIPKRISKARNADLDV